MPRHDSVLVDTYSDGLVGPAATPGAVIQSGEHVRCVFPPGCLGPIITPCFKGGHETIRPIFVEGARVGDAIAIRIDEVVIRSDASASGLHVTREGTYASDPYVDKMCPGCGRRWPDSVVEGIGQDAIRCAACGANVSPISISHGYTMVFDRTRTLGLTVDAVIARKCAEEATERAALPSNSRQHPILLFELSEMPGVVARLRPFIGNIGTSPSIEIPNSHNAGDVGFRLVGAAHRWALSENQMRQHVTDAHMDINTVGKGAILVCPVKVDGGLVYMGDMHASQGDGEIAGHAIDVAGEVTVQLEVIPGLKLEGPLLLPLPSDLPFLAKPYTSDEFQQGEQLASQLGLRKEIEKVAPIEFVGSGRTINDATDEAIRRAAGLLRMPEPEVRNRCTITGGVRIGRLPGLVHVAMLVPLATLEALGLGCLAREQYGL